MGQAAPGGRQGEVGVVVVTVGAAVVAGDRDPFLLHWYALKGETERPLGLLVAASIG